MVFSQELGYDPDEWEECSDEARFMVFGFFTRMFLSITSVSLMVFLFWFIEMKKRWNQKASIEAAPSKQREIEQVKGVVHETFKRPTEVPLDELAEMEPISKEEKEALEEWHRELAKLEELRMKELSDHIGDGSTGLSEIETESHLIDHFAPADEISMRTESTEADQQRFREIKGVSSISGACTTTDSSLPPRDKLDIELEKIEALAKEEQYLEDYMNEGNNANDWERVSPGDANLSNVGRRMKIQEIAMELVDSEEDHEADASPARLEDRKFDLKESTDSDEGFVKVLIEDPDLKAATLQAIDTSLQELEQAGGLRQVEQKLEKPTDEFIPDVIDAESIPSRPSTHPDEEIKELEELYKVYKVKKPQVMRMKIGGAVERVSTSSAREELLFEEPEVMPMTVPKPTTGSLSGEEVRRLAEADIYVHDAIEYVDNQRLSDTFSGFVVEEDMLESIGKNENIVRMQQSPFSGETTSQMVKTNEVFEKMEQIADIDDTMTYAPEIQSFEIPPDQVSENSENLLEYFDQVAAECTDVYKMGYIQRQPVPTARRIREYSPSQSSVKSGRSVTSSDASQLRKQSSLLSVLGVTSTQEMLLTLTSLEGLSVAMRRAGLESTNLIFGIDYTASNKYQGEHCFGGRSLHSIGSDIQNPYQQVITIMGRTLAPFASSGFIPAYGFGDAKTSDWSVFKLRPVGECQNLAEVLEVYNEVTPTVSLSGPTNFAPLIYQAIEICEQIQDYHILVIVADGQVTNERATRKAIVKACKYPLSIIVVGVGDGPWDMMRIFDNSLPKRPWDNFHFVEFNEVMRKSGDAESGELSFAIQSLLEIPDQYNIIKQLGLVRGSKIRY